MPLQNPQRRNSELTRMKVNSTFLPSAVMNMPVGREVVVVEAAGALDVAMRYLVGYSGSDWGLFYLTNP